MGGGGSGLITMAFQFSKQVHFKDNQFPDFVARSQRQENVNISHENSSLLCAFCMVTTDLLFMNNYPKKEMEKQDRRKSHYLVPVVFRTETYC